MAEPEPLTPQQVQFAQNTWRRYETVLAQQASVTKTLLVLGGALIAGIAQLGFGLKASDPFVARALLATAALGAAASLALSVLYTYKRYRGTIALTKFFLWPVEHMPRKENRKMINELLRDHMQPFSIVKANVTLWAAAASMYTLSLVLVIIL